MRQKFYHSANHSADIRDYYRRKRAGEDMTGYTPPGTITEPPAQFKRWMEVNNDRLAGAAKRGTTPYFIANNAKYTDPNWKPTKATPAPEPRPKTPLEIADERHARRTAEEEKEIRDRWEAKKTRDRNTRLVANNVLKLRSEYPRDVDFNRLEHFIATGNLDKMRAEAKNVAQAIKAIRDEEKALADLIPDAHGWHKQFGIAELREAHDKIQSTLDYWKAKGYDLATDSNLDILKKELEQKIKFVENPGAFKAGLKAHKTWQVQKQAYENLLGKVETRIETIKLEADYQALLGFKTTSKDFKEFMAKAKAAIDAGDVKTAKSYLASAEWKKNSLEAKRKGKTPTISAGKPGGVKFDASEFTQKKKDDALWFGGKLSEWDKQVGWNEADKYMTPLAQQNWLSWNPNQREVGYLYTSGSRYINEPLFATYCGSKKRAQ